MTSRIDKMPTSWASSNNDATGTYVKRTTRKATGTTAKTRRTRSARYAAIQVKATTPKRRKVRRSNSRYAPGFALSTPTRRSRKSRTSASAPRQAARRTSKTAKSARKVTRRNNTKRTSR